MNRYFSFLLLLALGSFSLSCDAAQSESAPPIGESGNWVKKRLWVKQAQASNDALQKDVTTLQTLRGKFYEAYQTYENASNQFYLTKGFARGKIQELVVEMQQEMTEEKAARIARAKAKSEEDEMPLNYYDVQIEAIEDDVKRFEKELKQFELDMKSISDVDQSLLERLVVMDRHITESTGIAEKSAQKLEEMWWMIDDTKARDAYYEIKGLAECVASIKDYLEGPLLSDLKKVGEGLLSHISQVEEQIASLEQRGVIVEHRTERLEQRRVEREKLEKMLAEEREREEAPLRRKRKRKAKQSWVSWLWSGVKAALSWVGININSQDPELARRRRARRSQQRADRAERLDERKERHGSPA